MAAKLREDPDITVHLVDAPRGELVYLVDGQEFMRGGMFTTLGRQPSMKQLRAALDRARQDETTQENEDG